MNNAAAFFAHIRSSLFGNRLTAAQVEGINAILAEWHHSGSGDDRQLAYVLATAMHETGGTMQPVREAFGNSDADTIRKLDSAWRAGKLGQVSGPYWREGFFGRGFVQLTHRENYERMGHRLGVDLVNKPTRAMRPDIAARILIIGMCEGTFTSKSLSDYIGRTRCDYVNARRIVNGTDRAAVIAAYAREFEAAIQAAGGAAGSQSPETPPLGRDRGWLGGIAATIAIAVSGGAAWLTNGPVLVFALVLMTGAGVALWKREKIKDWINIRKGR